MRFGRPTIPKIATPRSSFEISMLKEDRRQTRMPVAIVR